MAQMSLEELYRGEGAGEKYGIMGEVMKDFPPKWASVGIRRADLA